MSDTIKVAGTVKLVEETKEYGAKGFKKRLCVIETDAKYNNVIAVEATQDKCELFDGVMPGDEVEAYVNIEGREWSDRFFVSLNCWRIQNMSENSPNFDSESETTSGSGNEEGDSDNGSTDSDLPF